MISTFTMEAGFVIAAVLAVVGVVQWKWSATEGKIHIRLCRAGIGDGEPTEGRRTA